MSHLLVIDLPGGNDGDVLSAALALGHRYTLASADPAHYRAQAELGPLLDRAVAVLALPADGAGWAMAMAAAHRADPFDAVLCLQDLRLVEAARVARALGLRHVSPGAAALCRDKAAVRARLAEAGIAQPPFALVEAGPGAGARLIEADLVAQGPGDYGLGIAARGALLVERLFDGPVLGCDVMRVDGRQVLLGVNEKIMAVPPSFAILGGCFTAHCGQFVALDAWLTRVLDAVGFADGAAHVELVMTADGPQLVEINPRLVGARIARLIGAALGRSVHADLIRLHLAGELPPPANQSRHAVTRWLIAHEPGVLAGIDWAECPDPALVGPALVGPALVGPALVGPALVGIVANAHPGDTVRPALDNADRLAMVMTAGPDRAQIEALAERVVADARVRLQVPESVSCTG